MGEASKSLDDVAMCDGVREPFSAEGCKQADRLDLVLSILAVFERQVQEHALGR